MSGPNDTMRPGPAEHFSAPSPVSSGEDLPFGKLPCFFGDYELLEELGHGGMGIVYKARQRSLNRIVALKMIRDSRLAQGQTVERFYPEARAAAALDHPGIVPIYGVGQHDGRHYFTMALVEGTNLEAAVRQEGPPTPEAAAALVAAVADAVEYAHRHGVIHRDLKPENILLEGRLCGAAGPDRPRVTDFGLAKHTGEVSGLTGPGEVMGTPDYMAPEQARGDHRAIGPRTDVHALGAILYFLLTGRPPFGGAGLAVLYRVMEEVPAPPSQLNPRVPKGLEAICLKCLEKAPDRRYTTAGEVAGVLWAWARLGDPAFGATVHFPSDSWPPPRAAGRWGPTRAPCRFSPIWVAARPRRRGRVGPARRGGAPSGGPLGVAPGEAGAAGRGARQRGRPGEAERPRDHLPRLRVEGRDERRVGGPGRRAPPERGGGGDVPD